MPVAYRYRPNPLDPAFLQNHILREPGRSGKGQAGALRWLRSRINRLRVHSQNRHNRLEDIHPTAPAFLVRLPDEIIQMFYTPASWGCSKVGINQPLTKTDEFFRCAHFLFGLDCNQNAAQALLPATGPRWNDVVGMIASLQWLLSFPAYGSSPNGERSYEAETSKVPILSALQRILDALRDDHSSEGLRSRESWDNSSGKSRNAFLYNLLMAADNILMRIHQWIDSPYGRPWALAGVSTTETHRGSFDVLVNTHVQSKRKFTGNPGNSSFRTDRIDSIADIISDWCTTVLSNIDEDRYFTMIAAPARLIANEKQATAKQEKQARDSERAPKGKERSRAVPDDRGKKWGRAPVPLLEWSDSATQEDRANLPSIWASGPKPKPKVKSATGGRLPCASYWLDGCDKPTEGKGKCAFGHFALASVSIDKPLLQEVAKYISGPGVNGRLCLTDAARAKSGSGDAGAPTEASAQATTA